MCHGAETMAGGEEVPDWILAYMSGLLSAAIQTIEERGNTEGVGLHFDGASLDGVHVTAEWHSALSMQRAALSITIGPRPG